MVVKNFLFCMKILNFIYALAFFVIFFSPSVIAQKYEVGVFAGGTFYRGEVSKFSWRTPGGAIGLMFRQNWTPPFSTQISVFTGMIQAKDSDNPNDEIAQQRNFYFKTKLFEIALTGQYNFRNFNYYIDGSSWTPYLFGGVALFNMSVQDIPDGTPPSYSSMQFAIPFGIGAKFAINQNWNFNIEFGARKTFTDYLDDILVRWGRNPQLFTGNPNNKDTYFLLSMGVSYIFQGGMCPNIYKVKRRGFRPY